MTPLRLFPMLHRVRGRLILALIAASLVRVPPALAQTRAGAAAVPSAMPLPRDARIVLDGRVDEAPWSAAHTIGDLRQHDPDVGMPASERTYVRVAYDARAVYVAVVAVDSRPREIIARILTRDRIMTHDPFSGQLGFAGDDGVAILIDPFRDRRNAVIFATNPNGAEFEAQVTDQGREVNVAWRTVWRVAAAPHDSGWSAEFELPLRSFRHPDDGRAWGFNVYRVIRRKNEHVMWRSWSRDNAGFLRVSEAGDLPGIRSTARDGIGIDLKASAIGRAVAGDVHGRRTPVDGALDLKYELRPGVTLDATANTDFAQADVDDVQINLTRFDLFFPERRDFFLENAGVFEFGTRGTFEPPPWLMFFSRRIGISDSGEVPVLGGVRLTGREGAQTFGALHMQTAAAFGEPRAGFTTARFKRDVGRGGFVGAMYAGRSQGPSPPGTARGDAHSVGLDALHWIGPSTSVQGFVARVQGDAVSAAPARDRTAYRAAASRDVERWGVRVEHLTVGPSAEPPVGFATRTDIRRHDAMLRLSFRPAVPGFRRLQIYEFAQYVTRGDGALQDWGIGPALDLTWESGENLTVYRLQSATVLDESFTLADRVVVDAGRFSDTETGLFFNSASHRPLSVSLNASHQAFYGGRLVGVNGTVNLAIGARGSVALTRAFNDAGLPNGRLITHVSAARVGYAFNTRSSLATTVQYDALDRRLAANVRLSYQYRPGSELFLVLNSERESGVPATDQPRTALLKATYLSRW